MGEDLKKVFSANLREQLYRRGKSQADLRRYMDVSSATASDWCNAKKIPRADKIQSICTWLNCELADLLEEHSTEVRAEGQDAEYYEDEAVQAVTDRLRTNPEYAVLFKAAADLKPEDVELVQKFIERMSD